MHTYIHIFFTKVEKEFLRYNSRRWLCINQVSPHFSKLFLFSLLWIFFSFCFDQCKSGKKCNTDLLANNALNNDRYFHLISSINELFSISKKININISTSESYGKFFSKSEKVHCFYHFTFLKRETNKSFVKNKGEKRCLNFLNSKQEDSLWNGLVKSCRRLKLKFNLKSHNRDVLLSF